MKILLIASRPIAGHQTGRKVVLRTIVRSCEALGHHVDVAVIGTPGADRGGIAVTGPGLLEVCGNVVRHFAFGRKSLNECLYWSRGAQRQVDSLVTAGGYDLVVADMVRTAQFCAGLDVPWILDLDDLLSARYARLVDRRAGASVLGYVSARLPAVARRGSAWAAQRLLRIEARRIAGQELRFGRRASAVTLVSALEARTLSARLQRAVHDTAMSMDVPPSGGADHAQRRRDAVVFIGGLDYQPNLDAVNHYLTRIAPELERLGHPVELHVIGNAPTDLRPASPPKRVAYLGYVDDLAAALRSYSISIAPIDVEGGVKTKVLDAMANGLAVVATEQAVAGLGVASGRDCLVAQTPAEFALAICRLADDADACQRIGQASRHFVSRHFSHAALKEKWRRLLDEAVRHHAGSLAPAG